MFGSTHFRPIASLYSEKECFTFSADGSRIAAVANDWGGEAVVWECPSGRTACRFAYGQDGTFDVLRFSADGSTIIGVGHTEGGRSANPQVEVRRHDASTGKLLSRTVLPTLDAKERLWAAISPDGRSVLARNEYGPLRRFITAGGVDWRLALRNKEHELTATAARDGSRFAATILVGDDIQLRVFDAATGQEQGRADLAGRDYRPVISDDGTTIATVNHADTIITLWDAQPLAPKAEIKIARPAYPLAFSPDRRWLAVQARAGGVDVYDATSRKWAYHFGSDDRNVVAFTPDSKTLAHASGGLALYDAATGKLLPHSATPPGLNCYEFVYFSPDSRTLTAHTPNRIKLGTWDVATGRELERRDRWKPEPWERESLAPVTPGARYRLERARDSHPAVIDQLTGRPVRFARRISVACASPDWRTVAASSLDEEQARTIYLYETATGKVRHTFDPGDRWFGHGAFSPDGRFLATLHPGNPVVLWDVRGELTRPAEPQTASGWAEAWEALGSDDAKVAFAAIRLFAAHPERGLPVLQAKVAASRPAPAPSAALLAKLIEQLGWDDFHTREAATSELKAAGRPAEPAMRAALKTTTSPEVRDRLTLLLARDHRLPADEVRTIRAVEAVEWIGTRDAANVLRQWAVGPPDATLTTEAIGSLARLNHQ